MSGSAASGGSVGDHRWEADIAITEHGVVHVTAADWGSLGFGQGWGCGRDNLGVIADQVTKALGQRSRYWGAGAGDRHLASDFGYAALDLRARGEEIRAAQPEWIAELVAGYRAGYNLAVREADPEQAPQWCRGAPWIRELEESELWAHLADVTLMASGRNLVQLIGRAEAPGPDGPVEPSPPDALGPPAAASNGWAVGGDLTETGSGIVLANPHFPWYGEARFWECHLRIPGTYDVYGVSLLGTPGIQIGFNSRLGWAHTFSRGHRFTVGALRLDASDPTLYHHGERIRSMTSAQHTVEVASGASWTGAKGAPATTPVARTLWRSHHGPMLNMPLLGWGLETAYTYRDANIDNTAVLEQFLRMGMSSSVGEMRRVFHEVKGLPWVNTLAADADGDAWYTDASATPRLSQGAQERFGVRVRDDLVAALMYQNRIALLDGSDPNDDWLDHPDARSPGLEPPQALPEIQTRHVVANANDSHWLNSLGAPLEGYSVMGGLERTPRSLRTRQNLLLAQRLAQRGSVHLEDLLDVVFANESLSATLLRDAVLDRVDSWIDAGSLEGGSLEAGPLEVGGAAVTDVRDALAGWDTTFGIDSAGGALWREFIGGFAEGDWLDAGGLFAEAFDPQRPLDTPCGLAPLPAGVDAAEGDPVIVALGGAVGALRSAGVALDAAMGECQWADRGEVRVPVHGGGEGDGVMNVVVPLGALPASSLDPIPTAPTPVPGRERTGLGDGGYRVTYGSSFVMAVELTPDGPRGRGVLAYGQSSDPASPHHLDGTAAFSEGATRVLRFTDAQIEASPELTRLVLRHDPRPQGGPQG
ncbi:MAG: penicillin acylase family protein [Microthrixaceae bacterium]